MSNNEHRKRGLDDSDNQDSDSDDRRHKRVAVPDELSESQEKPLHRRRDEDGKMPLGFMISYECTELYLIYVLCSALDL